MHFIILSSDGVSLMHIEKMYIGCFPFHYLLMSTSPTAVTSHHVMSFRIIFFSEREGSQNIFPRIIILPLDMVQVA